MLESRQVPMQTADKSITAIIPLREGKNVSGINRHLAEPILLGQLDENLNIG
jgi:hypothetical protein